MNKKGRALYFSIIEILFIAVISLALYSYIQSNVNNDEYWHKYYSKDLALISNIIQAVPQYKVSYYQVEGHNYTIHFEKGRFRVDDGKTSEFVAFGNSLYGRDRDIVINELSFKDSNFEILKMPTSLSVETAKSQFFRQKKIIGVYDENSRLDLVSIFSGFVNPDECEIIGLDNTVKNYDLAVYVTYSDNKNKYKYYDNNVGGNFGSCFTKTSSTPNLNINYLTDYLWLELTGRNDCSDDLEDLVGSLC